MNMVKRVSCRVVKSAPLGKNTDTLRHTGQANKRYYEVVDAVAAILRRTTNSVTYANHLGTAEVSVGDYQMGLMLDCCA